MNCPIDAHYICHDRIVDCLEEVRQNHLTLTATLNPLTSVVILTQAVQCFSGPDRFHSGPFDASKLVPAAKNL